MSDSLPLPCDLCRPFEGNWMDTEKGLRRCTCERGRALKAARQANANPRRMAPVLNSDEQTICTEGLAAIPFFPAEPAARAVIGSEISAMCHDMAEALWLVNRMVALFRKWPGVPDMRAVYCSKFHPLDGRELTGCEAYPDGIPSERADEPAQLEAGRSQKALPSGAVVSAAPSVDRAVVALAAAKGDPERAARPAVIPEIPLVRPAARRITREELDAAALALREQRARAELEEQRV